jgi:hypothetical protein
LQPSRMVPKIWGQHPYFIYGIWIIYSAPNQTSKCIKFWASPCMHATKYQLDCSLHYHWARKHIIQCWNKV